MRQKNYRNQKPHCGPERKIVHFSIGVSPNRRAVSLAKYFEILMTLYRNGFHGCLHLACEIIKMCLRGASVWIGNCSFCYRVVAQSTVVSLANYFEILMTFCQNWCQGCLHLACEIMKICLRGASIPFQFPWCGHVGSFWTLNSFVETAKCAWLVPPSEGRFGTTCNGFCIISIDGLLRGSAKTLYRWPNSDVLWCFSQ